MCGIYACFHHGNSDNYYQYNTNRSRGPDETRVLDRANYKFVFHRLAIVSVENGHQPFASDNVDLMCNGEIYNYRELEEEYGLPNNSGSDCEVILHLYRMFGIEQVLNLIKGEFAFILSDKKQNLVHFARDPIGIKPLYICYKPMCSELVNNKIAVLELSSTIRSMFLYYSNDAYHVKPGTLYTYDMKHKTISSQVYKTFNYAPFYEEKSSYNIIYDELKKAVIKRITQTERPFGFFLSGGIDSCAVLSIAMESGKLKEKPKVFTFGFYDSAPDVKMAKVMVSWLKQKYGENCLEWHLVIEPIENGLQIIPEVILALETYDTTTIRASTPMYMLSKYISEKTNVKVLLSGEGSDELFGGYLYNMYAPNNFAFRAEIINSLNNLYYYDVLRADRTTAACGLEVRPPFLDIDLISVVLNSPELKNGKKTKQLLRNILADNKILPLPILEGRKEAFSDAVGLDWQEQVEKRATLIMETIDQNDYSPHIVPTSNTAKYFQYLFLELVGRQWNILPKLWLPNQLWVNTGSEPSARALSIYSNPELANTIDNDD